MPQIIFTFTINSETQEASFAGNVPIEIALQILQQLTIAEMVKRSQEKPEEKEKQDSAERKGGKGK